MRYEDIDDYDEYDGIPPDEFADLNHPRWFEGLSDVEIDLINKCGNYDDTNIEEDTESDD